MCNWKIVLQELKVKGETVLVGCKEVKFRPTSDKEQANGSPKFKPLGILTYRICFQHIKDDGIFRIVAQYRPMKRKGEIVKDKNGEPRMEWRINLHDPDQTKPVEMVMRKRVSCVTLDHPYETQVVKKSTGTVTYTMFFNHLFKDRIRDASLRTEVQQLLDQSIN